MEFRFNDFAAKVDNTDVAMAEKYEKCLEKFYCDVARIDMGRKTSHVFGDICDAAQAFLDGVLGDGTTHEMFGEVRSVRKYMEAVCALHSYMADINGAIDSLRQMGA